MLGVIKLIRRAIEGSVSAMLLIASVAILGASNTINLLLADGGVSSVLFLVVIALVLADLIAKLIGIVSSTVPELIPILDDDDLKRASLINRLRPGQTVALLSGAYTARVALFVIIFAHLGSSYAAAPQNVQESLFGTYRTIDAIEAFLRVGIAGSVGYFLFFLGPDNLTPITKAIVSEPLVSATIDGDIFLAGIRLYGFAFVVALIRTLVTPITFVRARVRALKLYSGSNRSSSAKSPEPSAKA